VGTSTGTGGSTSVAGGGDLTVPVVGADGGIGEAGAGGEAGTSGEAGASSDPPVVAR
jgi:hypothetical protein